ncbi:uncharacterized protein LOC129591995 [Paramacrobiotus metropolitanus]|uniref:uncharacterized protein LOC129591995 n=1 Tax=Paramacrobiotus metropolitanus TaxID=2943436 RepID=UPI00244655E8|nr:uncharacterized protein LOC129591995 [Paramacrobiotus metropolitanus]
MLATLFSLGALILAVHADDPSTWLGTLDTLAHGVNGEVFAEDDHTLLIKSFVYDGETDDGFFVMSKGENLEEPLEYIADEVGSRQSLATYMNEDIRLRLNPGKTIADYKSFGVYCQKCSQAYGMVTFNKFPKPFVRSMVSLGKLANTVHHVSGEVFAIDERTLLLKGFNYDGLSEDGQFVLYHDGKNINGTSEIIDDEDGTDNPLVTYRDMDVILRIKAGKKISHFRGFAVYCGKYNLNFGNVDFPLKMRIPRGAKKSSERPIFLGPLVNNSHNVGGNVFKIDDKTILITRFTYDGMSPDGQFVLTQKPGVVAEPVEIIGDERTNKGPLRKYNNRDIFVNLNHGTSLDDFKGLSIYCAKYKLDFGHVFFPTQSMKKPTYPLMWAKANLAGASKLGSFRTLMHNVSGEVYALDDTTLFIKGFSYDGTSPDGKFVLSKTELIQDPLEVLADEWGTSNDGLLEYVNKDIIIRLNPGTKLSDYKALAVYCADYKLDFGHVIFGSSLSGLSQSKEDPNSFINTGVMW